MIQIYVACIGIVVFIMCGGSGGGGVGGGKSVTLLLIIGTQLSCVLHSMVSDYARL